MEDQFTIDMLNQRFAQLHHSSLKLIQFNSIDHLLEQIATISCQQTGADCASVSLRDENNRPGKTIAVHKEANEHIAIENPAFAQGIFPAMMAQGSVSARFPPEYRAKLVGLVNQYPEIKTFLYVPILQGNTLIGQILVTNKVSERSFTSDDQKVLEMLAAYATIGITNAGLRTRLTQRDHSLSRRNENLALLNDLASTLTSASEMEVMLEETLSQVIDSLHLAAGELYLCLEDSKIHQLLLHCGDTVDHFWKKVRYETGEGIIGKIAQDGQPLVLDLLEEEAEDLNENLLDNRIQQVACFPLSGQSGSLGVLCIATCQPQPLDALAFQFLTIISSWVGTVIENTRLNIQQRRMAVLEERKRIGMDLHDGIIQSIYAVGLTLEHARLLMNEDHEKVDQRIEQAISGLNSTIRDLRSYILDLRPHYLQDENLMLGIQRLVNEFRVNTLVEVNMQGSREDFRALPEVQALALFHICQEALANVAKHAKATSVSVSLWTVSDRGLLEVHDNGLGFDMKETKLSLGHGLSNMQIRARNVGGEVDVSSDPGAGTTILAWVPFPHSISPEPVTTIEESPEASS